MVVCFGWLASLFGQNRNGLSRLSRCFGATSDLGVGSVVWQTSETIYNKDGGFRKLPNVRLSNVRTCRSDLHPKKKPTRPQETIFSKERHSLFRRIIHLSSTSSSFHTSMSIEPSLLPEAAKTSLTRSRLLFDTGDKQRVFCPAVDSQLQKASLQRRRRRRPDSNSKTLKKSKATSSALVVQTVRDDEDEDETVEETTTVPVTTSTSSVLARLDDTPSASSSSAAGGGGGILVRSSNNNNNQDDSTIPRPKWHAPWKLSTVLSSHLGWVRSIAFDPDNRLFATGSADRTIKVWNFPKASVGSDDALQLTLTGHISPVRGLQFSNRHPYLFSCGEDKQVKCWDLETNQVVRHYHGHLSGVFCCKLHPTLDVLVTGGRDAVARVWDIRTKTQIHCLSGHDGTVGSVLTNAIDPQIITGSYDSTIKLWDLVAGKCQATLTHHAKAVRALVQPSFERTFLSGAADGLKQFQCKDGRFLKTMTGHQAVINALAVNDDGVVVSGGDDGSMYCWDYHTGYNYQSIQSPVQPGSLDAEASVMVCEFDMTGTRLITGEADKTIKIYKQDEEASEMSHPIDMKAWRKKVLKERKQRY